MVMNRREFILSLTSGSLTGLSGCVNSNTGASSKLTVSSLEIANKETEEATVTVLLTDNENHVHFWETVVVDAFQTGDEETSRSAGYHEFDEQWTEPRDYQLFAKWLEGGEDHSNRVADLPLTDECAHIEIQIDEGIQFASSDAPCSE